MPFEKFLLFCIVFFNHSFFNMNLLFALLIAFSWWVVSCGGTIFIGSILGSSFEIVPIGAIIGLIIWIIIMKDALSSEKRNTKDLTQKYERPKHVIIMTNILVSLFVSIIPWSIIVTYYDIQFYYIIYTLYILTFIIIFSLMQFFGKKRYKKDLHNNG